MYLIMFLIVCGGIILLVLQQQGKLPMSRSRGKLPPVERNLFNLEIGDIVQHEETDWFVEGKLIYNVDSYSWFEYLLRDDERILWLSVEEDDYVEVSLLQEAEIPAIVSSSRPEVFSYEGIEYKLVDSGYAQVMRLGNTLNRQEQRCKYCDLTG